MSKRNRNVKQALLARKEELLKELKYYEKRIDDARSKTNNSFYDESSDSEQEFTVELEPSISELKLKQSMLQTCLFATQELTGVQILQSEVNIMVNEPVFEKEPPVKEAGVWKEVTAECRVDLVPFSMTFYVHHPKRSFGSPQYRCLQITPVKNAHEQELALSVLPTVKTPSDAVEVLRNYARAHRSRRSSLARLAEKYADTLFMEPMPEGGYILKCANLLEVSWTLQNKGSPIAPFHHRLKFDLEYMDESYIKIITQAHRQLSDPAVETDERTLLLAKIINTCLQARKDMPINESESDTDKLTDKNSETKVKDSEIMAPPKTIPKKVKSIKRRNEDGGGTSKKAKIDNKENVNDNNRGRDDLNSMVESDLKSKNNEIDKQIKKTINSKNDGSTKESSGHKNLNANSNVAFKSNIDSNHTESNNGNTDLRNKEADKDLNEKVIKKSKISSNTDNKEAKENLMKENKSTNDKNGKDQTNDAKTENKNSVANSKNEKNKKAKSQKLTTEVTNDVYSNSESVTSKNNTKNKDGSKTDNNEITNQANNKGSKNKNANNKKGTKEIGNDLNSKSEPATSKNDKNNLNNNDVNNKNNKENLKNKNAKNNKETIKATSDTNSKSENVNSKNDKNNLKNKNVSNKKDTNTLSKETNSKSDNKNSKMNKDDLINKNINNKGTKEIVNDINSKSEKNVKTLNSKDKENVTETNKNKNVAKSDAKTKNINNVVSKNPDNTATKVDNNLKFTKSNDKNELNKKENTNEKNNLKTKLNPENVVTSKKSKTESKNDKNAEKLQKITTRVDINKKDTTNIEKQKPQSLMQRFSKPNSVANRPNVASNKKIISPKIMKNKSNVNAKISVIKNILSVSKHSDKNISKIPQRIKSLDIKKNILRLSPRFIKKPSVMPKI